MNPFQPNLNDDDFNNTDFQPISFDTKLEDLKQNLIAFISDSGDADKIESDIVQSRIYGEMSPEISKYLIDNFAKNKILKNGDTPDDSWVWSTKKYEIDDHTLSLAKRDFLTRKIYGVMGAIGLMKTKAGTPITQEWQKMVFETNRFLNGIVDRLVRITTKYDLLTVPFLNKSVQNSIKNAIGNIIENLTEKIRGFNDPNKTDLDKEYITAKMKTDLSENEYLTLSDTMAQIMTNVDVLRQETEELIQNYNPHIENVKTSEDDPDKVVYDPREYIKGAALEGGTIGALSWNAKLEKVKQIKDDAVNLNIDLNSIKKAFERRTVSNQDKKDELKDKHKETHVTIPASIMLSIYKTIEDGDFMFPIDSSSEIENVIGEESEGEPIKQKVDVFKLDSHDLAGIKWNGVNMKYYYDHGYIIPMGMRHGENIDGGVIPWLHNKYMEYLSNKGKKGIDFSENVSRVRAEKILSFCVENGVVFNTPAMNNIQYTTLAQKARENTPGVENKELVLSKDTIFDIMSLVSENTKNRMIRFVSTNFERIINKSNLFLYHKI